MRMPNKPDVTKCPNCGGSVRFVIIGKAAAEFEVDAQTGAIGTQVDIGMTDEESFHVACGGKPPLNVAVACGWEQTVWRRNE